jgi:hypothetical protein
LREIRSTRMAGEAYHLQLAHWTPPVRGKA